MGLHVWFYYVYTRRVQKVTVIIVFFFSKKIFFYSSTLALKSSPLDITRLCLRRFFKSPKHFSDSIFGVAHFNDVLLTLVKRRPCKVLFIFGNGKRSHGTASGEHGGGWGIVTILATNSRTSGEAWTGALSRYICIIFCYNCNVGFYVSVTVLR